MNNGVHSQLIFLTKWIIRKYITYYFKRVSFFFFFKKIPRKNLNMNRNLSQLQRQPEPDVLNYVIYLIENI